MSVVDTTMSRQVTRFLGCVPIISHFPAQIQDLLVLDNRHDGSSLHAGEDMGNADNVLTLIATEEGIKTRNSAAAGIERQGRAVGRLLIVM